MSTPFEIIALDIQSSGKITVNNLPEFQELLRAALARINRTLETDEQFGQAAMDVKTLAAVEKSIRESAARILDEGIAQLFKAANETAEEPRLARLELEKLITAKRVAVKNRIVDEVMARFDIAPALARKHYYAGMEAVIVDKRTVASMTEVCSTYHATMHGQIVKCRAILKSFEAEHGTDLTMDRDNLQTETPNGLEAELRRRVGVRAAKIENDRLKAELEKARAEADNRLQDELKKAREESVEAVVIPGLNPPKTPLPEWIKEQAKAAKSSTPNGPTEADELRVYKAIIAGAFAPVKPAREALTFAKNIAKAQIFANALNTAWKESF